MKFYNTYDIDEAVRRFSAHPVLGPAASTLANLRDAADENSDGWAYWPAPVRAARKLIELIEGSGPDARWDRERADATPAKLKAAYIPLKAFQTRTGVKFELVEAFQEVLF